MSNSNKLIRKKPSTAKIGAGFEDRFEYSLKIKKWSIVRIPDGCKQVAPKKIVRVKSPFDFFATKNGKALFCDTKSCAGKTFPYSLINQNQLIELLKIHNNGFKAGYVIHFREADIITFIDAAVLSIIRPGQSVVARECCDLGKDINIDVIFLSEIT